MTLAFDFDDEPESHDGRWEVCAACDYWLPMSIMRPTAFVSWICKDTVACQQRQAERNLADDHKPD